MGFVIEDPVHHTGMHVDINQRGHVESVNEDEKDHAAVLGWKFNINTGDIAFTDAVKVSVLYVKNTGVYPIVVSALIYNLGNSTDGVGDALIEVIRNPTAAGPLTNTNDVAVGPGTSANQNFGSTNIMTGLFYKGAQGETAFSASDGVTISTRSASHEARIFLSLGALILPLGSAIGVNYTPPGSNSGQTTQFALAVHIRHPDVVAP